MSGSVEGLRINWRGSDVWLEFKGADLAFTVPDALAFEGHVSFIEDPPQPRDPSTPKTRGFRGGGKLNVIPAGIEIDADVIIGRNDQNPSYTFCYLYLST